MHHFPCPNPACRYRFTAQEVKIARVLACPSCKGTFQFRSDQYSTDLRDEGAGSDPAVDPTLVAATETVVLPAAVKRPVRRRRTSNQSDAKIV